MSAWAERQREFFTDIPDGGGVVRVLYDSAHGQPHRDTLDATGRVSDKDWLPPNMINSAAMHVAIRDINRNWKTYLFRLVRAKGTRADRPLASRSCPDAAGVAFPT